jgi:hypothetical protein
MKTYNLIVILFFILIISCTREPSVEIHPIEDRIPFWDYPIELQKNIENNQSDDLQIIISSAEDFLRTPPFSNIVESSLLHQMDMPYMTDGWIKFEESNTDQLIMLDPIQQALFEYQIKTNSWSQIAESGSGPDELSFANDITMIGDTIYVVSKESRITVFVCGIETECEFLKTINLEQSLNPVSISIESDNILLLGNKHDVESGITGEISSNSLFMLNHDGELIKSWGEIYHPNGHWMLLEPFSRGKVMSIKETESILYYFESFPFIYEFDLNQDLEGIYRIDDFDIVKREYEPNTGSLYVPVEDYSHINDVIYHGNGKAIVTVMNRRNYQVINQSASWDESKDFYLLNIKTNKSKYLGSLNNTSEEDVVFTRNYIITRRGIDYYVFSYEINE